MSVIHEELIAQDLKHIWHPCSQMKDYEIFKPLFVSRAYGSYLELADGKTIIDAISSWWCKSLGHNHPRLKQVVKDQIERFEHVILANTTNEIIVKLSQKLSQLTSTLNKIFYAGDGSCAVEIAMKMSLHAHQIQGNNKKNQFIALKNAYHGETLGALSVSDLGIYRKPYETILWDVHFIDPIPYVNGIHETLWNDCSADWPTIEASLRPFSETATALIVEPIVQGAGGMRIYSQDFLKRLKIWSKQHDVHLIADEIMTGIGRTGKMLACQHAGIEPDFLCLSKGLTSGWLPFSAVLTHNEIYQVFYDDFEKGKSFLHSHTYSGNALGACIALEVLNIMEEEKLCDRANQIGKIMHSAMLEIAEQTQKLKNVRSMGAIVAADLMIDSTSRRLGFEIYQRAVSLGALLRPLGNTIYWLLPLNVDMETIQKLKIITQKAIEAII